jgi:hypothetical protein
MGNFDSIFHPVFLTMGCLESKSRQPNKMIEEKD